MERIFAAIDNGIITNTFVADNEFAALVRPDHDDVAEITDIDPRPGKNWTMEEDGYRPPVPFPSWIWNGEAWTPPIPRPQDGNPYTWDEATQGWINKTPTEA